MKPVTLDELRQIVNDPSPPGSQVATQVPVSKFHCRNSGWEEEKRLTTAKFVIVHYRGSYALIMVKEKPP